MNDSISIEELLDAPEYSLSLPDDIERRLLALFSDMVSVLGLIGDEVVPLVPPDYRDRVCVFTSEKKDGTASAMIAMLPDGPHGLRVVLRAEHNERPCDHQSEG